MRAGLHMCVNTCVHVCVLVCVRVCARSAAGAGAPLSVALSVLNKTATRLPEALLVRVSPPSAPRWETPPLYARVLRVAAGAGRREGASICATAVWRLVMLGGSVFFLRERCMGVECCGWRLVLFGGGVRMHECCVWRRVMREI